MTAAGNAAHFDQTARLRPLDGCLVISLEQAVAAPLCTRMLADLGARVIKIERPEGDFARGYDTRVAGLSSHFVWCNRTKESVALDLKQPAALEVVRRLLARADVFVQNLAPGAAERLGLGREALRAAHPRLVVCEISGYGRDGPHRDRKAYDVLIQAEAGLLSVTGTPRTPARAGIAAADIAAATHAHAAILSALLLRARTGEGSAIDVSMLESLGEWMGFPLLYGHDGAPPPPRAGASHPTIYPYGPFRAADGVEVLLAVQNEREWGAFCAQVIDDPALADDPRFGSAPARHRHRDALAPVIAQACARHDADALVTRLESAGIACALLRDVAGVRAHPQLAARGRWRSVDTERGPVAVLGPAADSDAFDARIGPVPACGEHTEAVLAEFGYGPPERAALRAGGAAFGP